MAFKVAFLAHAPDAEPEKHKGVIETSQYKLFVVVANDQRQAVKVCQRLAKLEYGIIQSHGYAGRFYE